MDKRKKEITDKFIKDTVSLIETKVNNFVFHFFKRGGKPVNRLNGQKYIGIVFAAVV